MVIVSYVGVHRIFALAVNYADHVAEVGSDAAERTCPVFFMKPNSAWCKGATTVPACN
jgi:2-keto-4-pentenoate hydratase/2-oxohepta-3-ene-1,7-dioic acid hydratase in catechol pathway